jgi:hypothetical protein
VTLDNKTKKQLAMCSQASQKSYSQNNEKLHTVIFYQLIILTKKTMTLKYTCITEVG